MQFRLPFRAFTYRIAVAAALLIGVAGLHPVKATEICAVDLNGNGDTSDPGETAMCTPMEGGSFQCPIQAVQCTPSTAPGAPPGSYECPLGPTLACASAAPGQTPTCSPNACIDTAETPPVTTPIVDAGFALPDGKVDASNNCTANLVLFAGRALRCRPAGALDSFMNCCADRGKIIKDGMGSSVQSISTMYTVGKSVFTGVQAAFAAYQAGSTATAAADVGFHAIVAGIDPTSIAISLAAQFLIEKLLQGCDQQDSETGMLNGSGMCHYIGSYCSSKVLGFCIQKSHGHCCFNTKLGRIIQEQGRPQLASFNTQGWGTPDKPYCRGFTPEEFQALDFGKMDLSDYYSDLETQAQGTIQINMKAKVDAYLSTVTH